MFLNCYIFCDSFNVVFLDCYFVFIPTEWLCQFIVNSYNSWFIPFLYMLFGRLPTSAGCCLLKLFWRANQYRLYRCGALFMVISVVSAFASSCVHKTSLFVFSADVLFTIWKRHFITATVFSILGLLVIKWKLFLYKSKQFEFVKDVFHTVWKVFRAISRC